ncbi:MAG: DUF2059 domain-containing protein [bacterium]
MKKLILLTVITMVSCISFAQAEIPAAKRVEIVKMLQLTGTEKLLEGIKTHMISGLKTSMPKIPDAFWSKFETKMDMGSLTEEIIPLYDKYYTLEDLKTINAFYQSPIGQKVLSTSPQIFQESVAIGQKWGEKMNKEASDEFEKESGSNAQKSK